MARIALLTWGSHGDVVPFVALGLALREAGHAVFIGAQPYHAAFVRQQGLAFHALGGETSVERYQQCMEMLIDEANPRKQMRTLLQEMLLPDLEGQYQDALAAIQGAASDFATVDLVVAHWMQLAGMAAAESCGLPCVTVSLNPVGIAVVAETVAARNLGKMLSDYVWGDAFHHFRERHGLPKIGSVADYQYSKILNLVAISPVLLSSRETFEPQHCVTGFWPLKESRAWVPSAELRTFLSCPEKPVVFSFGSMGGRASEMTAIVLEAVRQTGCRAILQGGWAGLGEASLSAAGEGAGGGVLCVDYVPHDFLFSQAACVVHHGGAGTTSAALRAGVPSVIVWHMLDQPYWGNRLAELGLGPRPLARLNLQAGDLAERLREVLAGTTYQGRCATVAKTLAQESGTAAAVAGIEEFLRK